MINRRGFIVRVLGGTAAAKAAASGCVPTGVDAPASCVIVAKRDPHDGDAARRYLALTALAREMETRGEALLIDQQPPAANAGC